jgi:OmpA-OmpF porin, OOP family
VQREATVLFNFDRRDLANVRPLTKDTVDRLVAEVKAGWQLQRVVLTGHADISNNTRDNGYNVRLAQDRAQTVKAYLVSQGIPANLISTEARADSSQVVSCDAKRLKKADYEECLLPNRRVEVRAEGTVQGR